MRRNGAFSFLELLCIISITAILAALSLKFFPQAIGRTNRLIHKKSEGYKNIQKVIDPD